MENLNDVEFGSDKSGEEAPILVAQRYLNIFRQVHIFNKAKRDEFDDELLALPTNITDFFKRMPGGRLLVEHIEKVKTERGIAFVKANREDFDEGAGKTDTPNVAANGVVQAVAGNITIDASFADTLAQALANAFKQLPQSPMPISGGSSTITADFGNAFDIIAEEIRTSRASLLDVLKETRSITDSVIASQVSISRILEGILATRDRDDTDIADLNNRIIASQASITKLLEGLYTASNKKNAEISEYLNVENRLRRFREEITSDLDISLQKMQDLFRLCAQSVQDRKVIIETRPSASDVPVSVNSNTESVEKINPSANIQKSETLSQKNQSEQKSISIKDDIENTISPEDDEKDFVSESNISPEIFEHKKKKKKKKKNRDAQFLNESSQQPIGASVAVAHPTSAHEEHSIISESNSHSTDYSENHHVAQNQVPSFDGVIRNKAYKHEDNFDNVRLDVPPLDADITADNNISPSNNAVFSPASTVLEKQHNLAVSDSLNDFQPEQNSDVAPLPHDDLDFILADVKDEPSSEDVPDFSDIQNPDFSNVADDGLDFALPDTSFSDSNEPIDELNNSMGFENISNPENNNSDEDDISGEFDDDLDFTLPHASSARDDISSEAETLTSIDDVQDLDFSHPRNIGVSDKEHRSSSLSDDVLPHEQPYVSPSLMSNEENVSTSNAETTLEDNHAFEQNIADPSEMAINESQDMSTSLDSFMEDYVNKPATPMSQSGHEIENQEITNNLSPLDAFMAGNADDNDVIKQPVQDFDIQDNHSFASELDTFVEDENSIPNRELSSPIANNDGNISPLDAFMNSDTQTEGHIRQSVQSLDNQNGNTSISELDEFMEDKNATSLDINDNSSATDDDGSISPLDAFMADRNSETSNQPLDEAPVVSVEKAAVTNDEFSPQRESALDSREQSQSRYSTQLDKIREALTSDNIDISSLDQPIELDDYSDDENVGKDDYDDILSNISTPSDAVNAPSSSDDQYDASSQQGSSENDENWEWEYVDEDGNQIPENGEDDGDWEWEYVEDDSDDANVDDNKK